MNQEQEKRINLFIATHGNKFSAIQIQQIVSGLEQANEMKTNIVLAQDYKDPTTVLIISVVGGMLGIDRFMIGDTMLGILKLLTGAGCGIWYLIDLALIQQKTRDYNFNLAQRAFITY